MKGLAGQATSGTHHHNVYRDMYSVNAVEPRLMDFPVNAAIQDNADTLIGSKLVMLYKQLLHNSKLVFKQLI